MTQKKLIFIGGVHGVGKTTFCKSICMNTGYAHLTASDLINVRSTNKEVGNVVENQQCLLRELNEKKQNDSRIVLDGHYTLKTKTGNIEKVGLDVFKSIDPEFLVILHDNINNIMERIQNRDSSNVSYQEIKKHQDIEISHSEKISKTLRVPIYKFTPNDENKKYLVKKLS